MRCALLEEHAIIRALLGRVVAALAIGESAGVPDLWHGFRKALLAHLDAEDVYLIPLLPAACERDRRVLTQEHRHLRERVRELDTSGPWCAEQLPILRIFRDVLEAHARNDDRMLYEWAEARLDEPHRSVVFDALTARLDEHAGAM